MKKQAKASYHTTKTLLIASISDISGFPRTISAKVLEAMISSISKALKDGNDVRISGFGTFRVHHRTASNGRNPRTGKAIKIPPKKLPRFKASSQLKADIAQIVMEYKGYIADFTFDEKLELFLGRVSNSRASITFQAKSMENLRYAFQDAVNDYIEWCKKYGHKLEKPAR